MRTQLRARAKVTSKGQVTIPVAVRRALGIRTGDNLSFERNGDGVLVQVEQPSDPFAKYRGIGNPGIGSGREAVIAWVRRLRDPDAP